MATGYSSPRYIRDQRLSASSGTPTSPNTATRQAILFALREHCVELPASHNHCKASIAADRHSSVASVQQLVRGSGSRPPASTAGEARGASALRGQTAIAPVTYHIEIPISTLAQENLPNKIYREQIGNALPKREGSSSPARLRCRIRSLLFLTGACHDTCTCRSGTETGLETLCRAGGDSPSFHQRSRRA